MSTKRRWVLTLALICSLVVQCVLPGTARATSAFDGIIIKSDTLTLNGADHLATWSEELLAYSQNHPSNTSLANVMDEFQAALYSGKGWSLLICPAVTCGGGGYGQVVLTSPTAHYGFHYDVHGNRFFGTKADGYIPIYFRYGSNGLMVDAGIGAVATGEYTDSVTNEVYVGFQYYPTYTAIMSHVVYVNSPVDYPVGYEGEIVPSRPLPTYVAMGDSFSSGEGNSPFEAGTDTDDTNECHRSESAYPQWLSQTPGLHLEHMAFVACSGATVDAVLNGGEAEGAWGEPSQINALSEHTEVVTVTIGGNDIGFKAFATACATPLSSCDSSTTIYGTTVSNIHNILPGLLSDMLTEIANRTDHAHVYVIGYPYATPSSGLDSLPTQCSYLNGADSLAARAIVTNLNEEIDDAVTEFTNTFSDSEFEYIDPNSSVDGSFDGHDLCQDLDSYFHNVAPNDVFGNGYQAKIFHPNVTGQYEYYQIVKGVVEQN